RAPRRSAPAGAAARRPCAARVRARRARSGRSESHAGRVEPLVNSQPLQHRSGTGHRADQSPIGLQFRPAVNGRPRVAVTSKHPSISGIARYQHVTSGYLRVIEPAPSHRDIGSVASGARNAEEDDMARLAALVTLAAALGSVDGALARTTAERE